MVREHLGKTPVTSIVWFSHSAEFGGAEIALLEGVAALRERNIDVHVVLPADGPLEPRLQRMDTPVTVIPQLQWVEGSSTLVWKARRVARLVRWNVRSVTEAVRLLRHVRPDVAVTNTLTTPSGAIAAAIGRMPHVWYVHEFGVAEHGIRFDLGERLTMRVIDALSDVVTVNSGALRNALQMQGIRTPIHVIPLTVELPERARGAFSCEGLRLVQLGRLSPGKRQEDAVRAVGRLAETGVDVHLRLVGTEHGDYGSFLRGLIRDLDIADRVEIVPFTDNPAKELIGADVMVMCSRNEAFGRVTVEAMKLGTPVVGAASGGTAELIRDGWNGLLYRTGDPAALADKIGRLSRDRSLLATLGSNGQQWARETFNSTSFTNAFLAALYAARERS